MGSVRRFLSGRRICGSTSVRIASSGFLSAICVLWVLSSSTRLCGIGVRIRSRSFLSAVCARRVSGSLVICFIISTCIFSRFFLSVSCVRRVSISRSSCCGISVCRARSSGFLSVRCVIRFISGRRRCRSISWRIVSRSRSRCVVRCASVVFFRFRSSCSIVAI